MQLWLHRRGSKGRAAREDAPRTYANQLARAPYLYPPPSQQHSLTRPPSCSHLSNVDVFVHSRVILHIYIADIYLPLLLPSWYLSNTVGRGAQAVEEGPSLCASPHRSSLFLAQQHDRNE
jgi:hypothetical protein